LDFFSIPYSFRQGERQDSICRIKYNWEGSSLRRTCIEGLDALNAQAEEEAKELPGQVSGLSLEYAQKTTEGLVWQDSWPAENNPQQKKQHPQAVRIKLAVSGAGNQDAQQANAIEFTKVVSLE
jgi:hypothetical protein